MKILFLVRVRDNEVDKDEFTKVANEDVTRSYSPTERAVIDSARISGTDFDEFVPNDNGRIDTTENKKFYNEFHRQNNSTKRKKDHI